MLETKSVLFEWFWPETLPAEILSTTSSKGDPHGSGHNNWTKVIRPLCTKHEPECMQPARLAASVSSLQVLYAFPKENLISPDSILEKCVYRDKFRPFVDQTDVQALSNWTYPSRYWILKEDRECKISFPVTISLTIWFEKSADPKGGRQRERTALIIHLEAEHPKTSKSGKVTWRGWCLINISSGSRPRGRYQITLQKSSRAKLAVEFYVFEVLSGVRNYCGNSIGTDMTVPWHYSDSQTVAGSVANSDTRLGLLMKHQDLGLGELGRLDLSR
ncbi:hypothetical protein RRG08_055907 [Elysia crispata]|uniref:Uncharacterized protein n=1 Tax=Elysia crispata TaxID=231223 RepID=A0AAE1CS68_9GAST|nr:hypothetical protein RRG08_055907 [Elysia crispata]